MEWIVEAETIEDLVDGQMVICEEIVRCKDCRYYKESERWCRRLGLVGAFAKDGFCSRGERNTEESE